MLQINRGTQRDGFTFSLHPKSEDELRRLGVDPLRRIFIALDDAGDLQTDRGDLYEQVAQLLTRLSEDELSKFGGFEVLDPVTRQKVFPLAND